MEEEQRLQIVVLLFLVEKVVIQFSQLLPQQVVVEQDFLEENLQKVKVVMVVQVVAQIITAGQVLLFQVVQVIHHQ